MANDQETTTVTTTADLLGDHEQKASEHKTFDFFKSLEKFNCDDIEKDQPKRMLIAQQLQRISRKILEKIDQVLPMARREELKRKFSFFSQFSVQNIDDTYGVTFPNDYQTFWGQLLDVFYELFPPNDQSMLIAPSSSYSKGQLNFHDMKSFLLATVMKNMGRNKFHVPFMEETQATGDQQSNPNAFSSLRHWTALGIDPLQIIFDVEYFGHLTLRGYLDPLSMLFHDEVHNLNLDFILYNDGSYYVRKERCKEIRSCFETLNSHPDRISGFDLFYAFHEVVATQGNRNFPDVLRNERSKVFLADYAADIHTRSYVKEHREKFEKLCTQKPISEIFFQTLQEISIIPRAKANIMVSKICASILHSMPLAPQTDTTSATAASTPVPLTEEEVRTLALNYKFKLEKTIESSQRGLEKVAAKIPLIASCSFLLPPVKPSCYESDIQKFIDSSSLKTVNDKIYDKKIINMILMNGEQ
jgi:hypothetical protein